MSQQKAMKDGTSFAMESIFFDRRVFTADKWEHLLTFVVKRGFFLFFSPTIVTQFGLPITFFGQEDH